MPSFDIVSKVEMNEVDNAISGVVREIGQRFDFKGSHCTVERKDADVTMIADDETKLRQMQELLRVHMTRRKVEHQALSFGEAAKAAQGRLRQVVTVRQGIDRELAKSIVQSIKGTKLKVQVAVQGDELRVSGKKIDELQDAIAHVRGLGIEQPLQYVNFRS
ncbi:MAG: YajQ family cyclic di-GMP-binding protein [Alphaproteobacteria bacterium]|nr:YajQ family cyclic di-GMP-binding protein [Alphaproteobacteria bacterium]